MILITDHKILSLKGLQKPYQFTDIKKKILVNWIILENYFIFISSFSLLF